MKHTWNIVRKELDKIFKNPRLIFSTFILPGLLIFFIYSYMGTAVEGKINETIEHTSIIHVVNYPASFADAKKSYEESHANNPDVVPALNIEITEITDIVEQDDAMIAKTINEETIDAWIVFEEDFDHKMDLFLQDKVNNNPPAVKVYYNVNIQNSSAAYSKIQTLLGTIENTKNPKVINIHDYSQMVIEQSEDGSAGSHYFAMMLPMFITIFVFAGGLSIGSDAIAGEKERGTIATLLMAPIDKSKIVFGKIVSTIIITLLSATGSFIGTIASFSNTQAMYGDISEVSYGFSTYFQTFIVIILLALFASCLFLIASTIAKSTKEATMYAMPFYVISMIVSIVPMFDTKLPTEVVPYLIPLYNLTLGLKGIFMIKIEAWQILTIISSTVVYACILLILVRQLFKSERLMFQK